MQTPFFTLNHPLKASRIFLISISLMAFSFSTSWGQQQSAMEKEKPTELKGFQAEVLIPGTESIIKNHVSDVPEVVRLKPGSEIPLEEFANWHHKNLKTGADYDFKLMNEEKDTRQGYTHYRYQQTYKGIPVEGTMYILHVKEGKVYSMSGQIFNKLNVDAKTSLTESDALSKALAHVGAQKYAWEVPDMEKLKKVADDDLSATYFPKGELVLVANDGNFAENNFTLAYKFDIYSYTPYDRKEIYVDAKDGHIVNEISEVENSNVPGVAHTLYSGTQNITCDYNSSTGVFSLMETGRGKGIITYNGLHHTLDTMPNIYVPVTNTSSVWDVGGIDTATDAHWGSEKVYDFYDSTFNRNSIDGNGLKIISMMHVGHYWQNAEWNGTYMEYGDGCGGVWPFTNIVVIGHEMTHGVTQYTAGLVDANGKQSGALNEGFSDIFGVSVQQFATGSTGWAIGFCGHVDRNLANPPAVYDSIGKAYYPDTYESAGWDPKGEVHHNATVVGHWFYLLSVGGSGTNGFGNAYNVSAVGMSEAETIAYTTLTQYLTPTSGYIDARTLSIQAATDLYGANSNEVIQVTNAWYAVGVGEPYAPNYLAGSTTTAEGYSIAHDKIGNVYVAGSFTNTLTLGSYSLSGNGVSSTFVAKYDSSGNVLWAVAGGGAREADAAAICVDNHGNAYVAGTFTGGGVFNGTGGTSQNFPVGEVYDQTEQQLEPVFDAVYMYVAAYNANGALTYCVKGGETNINGGEVNNGYSGLIRAFAITCGQDSSVYVGGLFDYGQTVIGNITLTNSNTFAESSFFTKCKNGTFSWASAINSASNNYPRGMDIDNNGILYATGALQGNSTYIVAPANDSLPVTLSNPGAHPFVLTMNDYSGDPLAFVDADGTGTGIGNGISVINPKNPKGFVITGTCSGQLTFGSDNFTGTNGFIAHVNTSNFFDWVTGTKGSGLGVATDQSGSSYITGSNLIQAFDINGDNIWTDTTANGTYQCNSVCVDTNTARLSVTGYFDNSFGYNSQTLTASGQGLLVQRIPISAIKISNSNQFTCLSRNVTLKFEADGNIYPGNLFTAQLSDATKSFASPVTLGSVIANSEFDSITFQLPGNVVLTPITQYAIRVVSSDPFLISNNFLTLPVPNIKAMITASDSTLCNGNTATLTAYSSSYYKFLWYLNGTQLIGDTSSTLPITQQGTYKEEATYDYPTGLNHYSCIDTATVVIKGAPLLGVTSPVAIPCDSTSVTLSVTGSQSNTYTWSPSAGLKSTTGASVVANPTVVTTYTVTATTTSGCTSDTTIIVNPKIESKFSVSPSEVTIPCDSSVTLNAAGNDNTFTWSPADGLNLTNGSQVIASPTITTTYEVTGTTLSGCTSDTTVIVTVTKAPIQASSATIRCDSSVVLSANGVYDNYSWAPPKGLSDTSGASVTANPTITTTYTVTGTTISGCKNDTTVTVTVTKLPITVSPATIACDSPAVLNAISKLTDFTWAPNSGLSSTSGASVTASPTATTTYVVTGTTTSGCSSDTTVVVKVNKKAFSVNPVTIRCDSTATLTASGNFNTYSWSPSAGLNNTFGATVTANPTVTTTYSVTASTTSGCTSDTTVVVTVNIPTPVAIAGSGATASSITANWESLSDAISYSIDVATDDAFTGIVSGYGNLDAGDVTSYIINGLNPLTPYYYRVRAVTNCGVSLNSDTISYSTIGASNCKAPQITIGGPTTFCQGDSVTLDAGTGWASYLWSNSATTEIIVVTKTGNYSCSVISDTCHKISDTVRMTVNQAYTTNLSRSICQGTSYNLPWGGTATTAGVYSHTYSSVSGCDSTVNITLTVNSNYIVNLDAAICQGTSYNLPWGGTATTAGVYSHTYPSLSGCDSTVNITIAVNQVYTTNLSQSICQGSSYNLPWGGTATTAGVYSHTYVAISGCDSTVNITIVVNNTVIPSVSILANHSDTICSGTSVTFTATPVNGGTSPSYQWKVNGTDAGTNSATFNTNTLTNGEQVTVSMTSNATCASPATAGSNTITMTVNNSVTPSVSISANPGNAICSGIPVTFTATPVNGGTTPSYQWKLNGNNVGTSSSSYSDTTLANGNTVTVVLTSDATCLTTATANGNVITMTVNSSTPAAPIATAGSGATGSQINANWETSAGATSYFIDVSTANTFSSFVTGYDTFSAGNVTSVIVTGLLTGVTYYYRVRAKNSCGTSGNSNIISYATTNCASLSGRTPVPDSSIICSGGTQVLSIAGNSGETYQWQISVDDVNWSNVSSGGNSITYTTLASDGMSNKYYRCLIINSCYQASSYTAVVDVSTSPVVTISNVTSTTATVTWKPYSSGQYNISWTGAATGSASNVTTNLYTITGLTPNQSLQVTVTPVTSCNGVNAGIATAHTECAVPTNVQLTALASPASGFKISWSAVNGATSYRVYYLNLAAPATWSFIDTAGTSKTIIATAGNLVYAVYVAVANCPSAGVIGQGSTVGYVTTNPASGCNPIPSVTASSDCANQIEVNMNGGGPYILTIRKISPAISAPLTVDVSTSAVNIEVGTSGAEAVWEVYARKNCGAGSVSSASDIALVTVQPDCPIVSNLLVSEPDCNGFTASWNTSICPALGVISYDLLIKPSTALNYNAYPEGTTDHVTVSWLNPSTTYDVTLRALACNGVASGNSTPVTIALPACRDEAEASAATNTFMGSLQESVVVYPNPTQNQFFVDLGRTDRSEAIVKIELINQLGQVIQTEISEVSGGHLNQLINLPSGIASGIYFVRTSVGGNTYVNRLMVAD